eukprot:518573_1
MILMAAPNPHQQYLKSCKFGCGAMIMLDGNPNSLHNNNICHQSRRTGMHEYQSPAVAEIYATRRANVIFNQRSTLQNETDSSTPLPPPPSQPGQTVLSGHQQNRGARVLRRHQQSQNDNNDGNHSEDDNLRQ